MKLKVSVLLIHSVATATKIIDDEMIAGWIHHRDWETDWTKGKKENFREDLMPWCEGL